MIKEMSDHGLVLAFTACADERNRLARERLRVEQQMAEIVAEINRRGEAARDSS